MMKLALLQMLLLGQLYLLQPKPDLFQKFWKYVSDKIKVNPALKKDCKWYYALVKVKCSRTNKILSYGILNDVPKTVQEQFLFLNGYQFDKKITINQHPIIFCITFENHGTDCIVKNLSLPTETLKEVFGELEKQTRIDPKAIILYETLSATYNYDPIIN